MVDQLVGAQQFRHIGGLGNEGVAALNKLKAAVHDLDFAGPLALVAGHADEGTGGQQVIILLAAGHVVGEIGAVLILQVDGGGLLLGIVGLLGLDVGFNGDLGVQVGSHVLVIAHHSAGGSLAGGVLLAGSRAGGLLRGGGGGAFLRRGALAGGSAAGAGGQGAGQAQRQHGRNKLFHG